ncbi:hypothetical protein C8Q79DRAFT_917671 [Trametes meyenii]|nr:hypothetical protein C8Q79DRAFT_917671 [Trametes meyenii]
MPPHRALSSYDVLFTIFEHLEGSEQGWYDYDPSTGDSNDWRARQLGAECRCALARCARVCRAFFYPAVAILWRNVDDLSPIFDLLRTTSWSSKESHARTSATEIPRLAYLSEQAARVLQYAWRVRAVHGPRTLATRSRDTDYDLPAWVRGAQLFRQLRHLRWVQHGAQSTELVQVIPPSLRSLHIVFKTSSGSWSEWTVQRSPSPEELSIRELVRQVAIKAPRLRYLRVTTSGVAKEAWFAALGDFRGLDAFDVLEPIYGEVTTLPLIRPLASLRHLRHLKMRLPQGDMPCVAADAFASLRSLTLDAMFAPLGAIPAFLATISSPQVESVSLLNCECGTVSVHEKLRAMAAIVRSKFSPALREFVLSLRGIGPVHAHPQPLLTTLAPLLEMHDLRDVRISVLQEVAVVAASEHDLQKMSEAWPKASRLHLSCYPSLTCPPLVDLVGAARQCSGLSELILPGIAVTASDMDDILAMRNAQTHGLRSLSLSDAGWHSRIPDPGRLARCLDKIFPAVDWRCPRLASDSWNETIQELVQLRIARLQNGESGC